MILILHSNNATGNGCCGDGGVTECGVGGRGMGEGGRHARCCEEG